MALPRTGFLTCSQALPETLRFLIRSNKPFQEIFLGADPTMSRLAPN